MEPARCEICRKPVVSWLNVGGKANVCHDCADKLTFSDLVTLGVAVEEPLPEIEVKKVIVLTHDNISEALIPDYNDSFKWNIDEICDRIRKLGFATEKAFFHHCEALYDGGYTQYSSYALLLRERYCEQTDYKEDGIFHHNALEGETREEAIDKYMHRKAALNSVYGMNVNGIAND